MAKPYNEKTPLERVLYRADGHVPKALLILKEFQEFVTQCGGWDEARKALEEEFLKNP
jgi:hypothetical protein